MYSISSPCVLPFPTTGFASVLAASAAIVSLVFLSISVLWSLKAYLDSRTPYPPGPPPDPIIGNARQMPSEFMWHKFAEWGQLYRSDVIHLRMFGQSLVVLNSFKAVTDLLEKRSTLYSDRPRMTMTAELMGFDWATIFTPYGPDFKKNRKLLHFALSPTATRAYVPMQEYWTQKFLGDVLDSPKQIADHVRRLSSVISMELAYGRNVASTNGDVFVKLAQDALDHFSLGVSGGWLVDFLPSLKSLPSWLPGTEFLEVSRKARPFAQQMLEAPFNAVKASMAAGIPDTSFTHTLLHEKGGITGEADEEDLVKKNAATLFGAGADTTVSTMMSFVLAMTLHPEIQRKAQEEIDTVVGLDRFPQLSDRPNLPFVECILKEVLRWNPAGPIGSPRRLMEDDIYKGWLLPGGATIIPNVWALMHDPLEYPDPFEFKPERFSGPAPPRDPHMCAFGFGRRVCPGMTLTSNTAFIFMAQMLAAFNIRKAVDENGRVIEPGVHFTSGVISHPAPFECDIAPRSDRSITLIRDAAADVAP